MNRQQFSEFVNNPASVSPQSLKMLKELVKRYPYCQTGQILYAYNLFREESLQYPLQLKKAAAYSSDRRKLKELVNTANKMLSPDTGLQQFTQKSPISSVAQPSLYSGITVSEIPKASDHLAETNPIIVDPINADTETAEFTGAVIKEKLDNLTVLPAETTSIAGMDTSAGIGEQRISSRYHISVGPSTLSEVTSEKDQVTSKELLLMVRKRLALINAEKHPATGPGPEKSDSEKLKEFASKEALINKFIIEEPRITKPKIAFFSPSESAHRSNMDEEEIVSETLAQLYAKQGNISKAIQIYKKLSLLNQEKSRYFAAQIEKLNN
ncbi:MAG: hypothetical protein M0Q38_05020 [Bacteroidales bacterium]|jgi:hypothetical protein|nr:hypothetical protein [Bacteroidales bacterium]